MERVSLQEERWKKLGEHERYQSAWVGPTLTSILSKNRKQIKFLSARDFLNLKGLSLSGQLSVLSFRLFVVLHGQSSHVVMYPQKIMVKKTFVTASLVLVWTISEHFSFHSINTPLYWRSSMEICVYE